MIDLIERLRNRVVYATTTVYAEVEQNVTKLRRKE